MPTRCFWNFFLLPLQPLSLALHIGRAMLDAFGLSAQVLGLVGPAAQRVTMEGAGTCCGSPPVTDSSWEWMVVS